MQLPTSVPLLPRTPLQVQRAVISALVLRELRARVGSHWLGLMWLVFEPLAHLSVILVLFTVVRHMTHPSLEIPVFLVTGILPFFVFRDLALRVGSAVTANRGLFNYRQVQPADTMVARAMVELGLYTLVFAAILAGLGWMGFQWLPRAPLELLGVVALLVGLGFGFGLVIVVASMGRPKVRSLIGIMFFPLYLMSGVLFPVSSMTPQMREWLLWNPVLHFLELSRFYFIPHYHRLPEVSIGYAAASTLTVLALGLALYRIERHRLRARN